jgi:hypothetical protein
VVHQVGVDDLPTHDEHLWLLRVDLYSHPVQVIRAECLQTSEVFEATARVRAQQWLIDPKVMAAAMRLNHGLAECYCLILEKVEDVDEARGPGGLPSNGRLA